MAYALVQAKVINGASGAFDSSVSAGNLVIVAMAEYVGHTASVTDSGGNTYAEDISAANATLSSSRATLYSSVIASGGTLTVTANSPGAYIRLVLMEFSGNASSSVLDGTGSASGDPSATPTTGSVTVSQADSLVVACFTHGSTTKTLDPGAGYTMAGENESDALQPIHAEYDLDADTSQTASGTIGASVFSSIVAASYKPAAGGGVGFKSRLSLMGAG